MDEEPAAGVHKSTGVGSGVISFGASLHALDDHLAWGQQVDSGDGSASNRHLTLERGDVEAGESITIFKEGGVWGAHRQLKLCESGHHTEKAHVILNKAHLAKQVSTLHF